tara:strand:- start:484 stop:1113 length:630 start_codon:yes stop_codon:yes gene_type:complete
MAIILDGTVGLQSPSATLANPLQLASGGTTSTSAPAAMATLMGFTSTATAAGTTTLTNTSSFYQIFTGVSNQVVQLPVTSTLAQGWTFHICNNSSGTLTVNSSGSNLVMTIPSQVTAMVTCIATSTTTAADWEAGLTDFSSLTGSGAVVLNTTPTIASANLTTGLTLTGATGTAGQVLTSAGGGAPTWSTPTSGITTGKSIAMAMIFGF